MLSHSNETVETKMQRITELQKDLDKKDNTMKNWNSVQEELRQKQLKTHEKVEVL